MQPLSSFAPHLGAALGAGLMLAASVAFQLGQAGEPEAATGQEMPEAAPLTQVATDSSREEQSAFEATGDHSERTASGERAAPDITPAVAATFTSGPSAGPQLAIIVDDVADRATLRALLALDIPLTVSILPYAEGAPQIAQEARAAGRDVFVHMPMEPVGLDDPGPYALTYGLNDRQIEARLSWAFARVPGAIGFNNHMGSRLTGDMAHMERIFAQLPSERSDLVFVDSLTSPRSVAATMARRVGLKSLRRDVFLDHDPEPAAIATQVATALDTARSEGFAIAIIHPRPASMAALEQLEVQAQVAGVELVGMAALVGALETRS